MSYLNESGIWNDKNPCSDLVNVILDAYPKEESNSRSKLD